MSELSGGKDVVGPLLEVSQGQVVSWRDDSDFVDSTEELDDDLLGSVIIDNFKLSDVSVLLHDS